MDMELMAECWDQSACSCSQTEGGCHPDLGHLRLGAGERDSRGTGLEGPCISAVGKETVRPRPQVITPSRYPGWGGHTSKK